MARLRRRLSSITLRVMFCHPFDSAFCGLRRARRTGNVWERHEGVDAFTFTSRPPLLHGHIPLKDWLGQGSPEAPPPTLPRHGRGDDLAPGTGWIMNTRTLSPEEPKAFWLKAVHLVRDDAFGLGSDVYDDPIRSVTTTLHYRGATQDRPRTLLPEGCHGLRLRGDIPPLSSSMSKATSDERWDQGSNSAWSL